MLRKKWGSRYCITPRRAHGPDADGPGSLSATVTSSPRRASAMAQNIPTGPPPMTITRIAASPLLSLINLTEDNFITLMVTPNEPACQ